MLEALTRVSGITLIGTGNDKNRQKQRQEQAKANAGVLRFAQNDKRFMTIGMASDCSLI
jgi:hypothetical protein